MSESGSIFSEKQQLSPRLQAFVYASTAIAGLGAYFAARATPGAEVGLYLLFGVIALVAVLFRTLTLSTDVTEEGVIVRGMLFINRLIRFADIASAEARRYKPIMEYGGWGYRIGPNGKAYNGEGDEGVQLALRDGGRVLIGSQRSNELANVIAARLTR